MRDSRTRNYPVLIITSIARLTLGGQPLILVQYASYPTTDIRHILPRLIPAFTQVITDSGSKALHGDSLAEKQDSGVVDKLISEPEGKEIKHDWLWGRLGKWFHDTGEWQIHWVDGRS